MESSKTERKDLRSLIPARTASDGCLLSFLRITARLEFGIIEPVRRFHINSVMYRTVRSESTTGSEPSLVLTNRCGIIAGRKEGRKDTDKGDKCVTENHCEIARDRVANVSFLTSHLSFCPNTCLSSIRFLVAGLQRLAD